MNEAVHTYVQQDLKYLYVSRDPLSISLSAGKMSKRLGEIIVGCKDVV